MDKHDPAASSRESADGVDVGINWPRLNALTDLPPWQAHQIVGDQRTIRPLPFNPETLYLQQNSGATAMAAQKQNLMTGPLPFFIISGYLILTAARRLLVTANEYPPREAQILEMVIDGASIVCLIGFWTVMSKTIKREDKSAAPLTLLFLVALVAGVTLFGIRFTSDAAWWTGHLNYALD